MRDDVPVSLGGLALLLTILAFVVAGCVYKTVEWIAS